MFLAADGNSSRSKREASCVLLITGMIQGRVCECMHPAYTETQEFGYTLVFHSMLYMSGMTMVRVDSLSIKGFFISVSSWLNHV